MNAYTVLITASGVGSGLGELTEYTNKVLLRVGNKPVLSHIIDSYPKNTHFVITLGHFGNHVKDFISLIYPHLNVTFVSVDLFEGPGSSVVYSFRKAAKYLQCPFIYHASDTIVLDTIPKPTNNWIGGVRGQGSANYTSFNVLNSKIQTIMEKGIIDPDFLYIGLSGIKDYKQFWRALDLLYKKYPKTSNLADYHVVNKIIEEGVDVRVQEFTTWYDTGNIDALKIARSFIKDDFTILDKPHESLFVINKQVVKFFSDDTIVKKRVKRAALLDGLVPRIAGHRGNYYTYPFIKGVLYANIAAAGNFPHFLKWVRKNLWTKMDKLPNKEFATLCYDFYYEKTKKRIEQFLKAKNSKDVQSVINGQSVPSIDEMLSQIDFSWLSQGIQSRYHGDLILDNIVKTKKGYTLLDWRQDFGGNLEVGDMYYDLAKLHHNLIINHDLIMKNGFTISQKGNTIVCDVLRKQNLVECQEVFYRFLSEQQLDSKKVKMLTALIWLNMSPLHHHPFDMFLFNFGKLYLWRSINEK